jgi:hypothetical protein
MLLLLLALRVSTGTALVGGYESAASVGMSVLLPPPSDTTAVVGIAVIMSSVTMKVGLDDVFSPTALVGGYEAASSDGMSVLLPPPPDATVVGIAVAMPSVTINVGLTVGVPSVSVTVVGLVVAIPSPALGNGVGIPLISSSPPLLTPLLPSLG